MIALRGTNQLGESGVDLEVVRTARIGGPPSRVVCEAAALLGVVVCDGAQSPRPERLRLPMRPGGAIAVVGPSGAGKSTLLADASESAASAGWSVVHADLPNDTSTRRVIASLGSIPPESAIGWLARVGLAEASVLTRRVHELSVGQRARLRLACAMRRALSAKGPTLLIVDELGSSLDRVSACAVGRVIGGFARREGVAVLTATHREEVLSSLNHSHEVHLHQGIAEVRGVPDRSPSVGIEIGEGSMDDYETLSAMHYREAAPALVRRVLVARDAQTDRLAGVLVVSSPTLNGAWRALAWPGVFTGGDKKACAARLNRELRLLSRLVVAPEYRAMGVATALVRAYLAAPETRCTEALAAMGRFSPFLKRAGMTEYPMPPGPRHARLLDALAALGVEGWRLATPTLALDRARRAEKDKGWSGFLRDELARWHRAPIGDGELEAVFGRACRRLMSTPFAYAYTRGG